MMSLLPRNSRAEPHGEHPGCRGAVDPLNETLLPAEGLAISLWSGVFSYAFLAFRETFGSASGSIPEIDVPFRP